METYTLFRIFLTVMSLGVAASVVAAAEASGGVAACAASASLDRTRITPERIGGPR